MLEVSVGDYGDVNEIKNLPRGSVNPGSRRRIIRYWGEVSVPTSFGKYLCAQPLGKGIIDSTNNLTDADGKVQSVGRKTSRRKIKTLTEIDHNDHPEPDPSTAASPKVWGARSPNCFQLDTGRVR